MNVARCSFNCLNVYLTAQRGALLGASADQTAQVAFSSPSGRTVSKLFETFFSLLMHFFSSLFVPLLSISFLISFRNLLGSIFSSHIDPPTLKNLDFLPGVLTCLKNQRFRSKDGFESVLGLS